jgi:hypothetical protein
MVVYIVIPYRNRKEQLEEFIKLFSSFQFDYKLQIIISEQFEEYEFNRGLVKNVGFDYICKHYEITDEDIFVLNDLDTLPATSSSFHYNKDMGDLAIRHICGYKNFCLGGVLSMKFETFKKCNGFPNNFWGWGGEDMCLTERSKKIGVIINSDDIIEIKDGRNNQKTDETKVIELKQPIYEVCDDSKNWPHVCYANRETKEMMMYNGLSNLKYQILEEIELLPNVKKIKTSFEKYPF